MAVFYFNADGDAIAWRRDEDDSFLFNLDGDPIGWFPWDDEDVYSMDSEYLGTIVEEDRLLRRTYQRYRGYTGVPGHVGWVGDPGYFGHAGYLGYRVGFEDVPEELLDADDQSTPTQMIHDGDGRAAAQAFGLLVGAAALIAGIAALVHVNSVRKERRDRAQLSMGPLSAPIGPAPGWYALNGELRFWDGARWTHHSVPFGAPLPFLAPVRRADYARGTLVAISWVFALGTMGYMVPWAIAVSRGTSNRVGVGLVNFFLGWTILGWIVAFAMSFKRDSVPAARW